MAEKTAADLMRFELPKIHMSPAQRQKLGARIVEVLRNRMFNSINVFDGPAKDYSPYGPIYMPLTWGIRKERVGNSIFSWPGRGVRQLGGRYSVKKSDYLKHLTKLGYPVRVGGKANLQYRDLKSAKFANYAEFKEFIGHSGKRDLSLTGKMLADIAMVADTESEVQIGFNSEEQQQISKGNERYNPAWGLSPSDRDKVKETFDEIV